MENAPAYQRLLEQLGTLPGIGKRSAERIAFHLLKQPEDQTLALAQAIRDFRSNLKVCSITGHVSEADPCAIVTDPKRDHGTILVVEQPTDVIAMEQTGAFRGSYHVLMGRLAPLDAVGPGDLNIDALVRRIREGGRGKPHYPAITEVILATNPTLEGDGTALYLADKLTDLGVAVTRLARGVPANTSIDKVGKAVLADAIHARRTMGD